MRKSENNIHKIVRESVSKVLSEISWKKSASTAAKAEHGDWSDNILDDISEIRDYLMNYESSSSGGYGGDKWKAGYFPKSQASKLLPYLDEIERFVLRKKKQTKNLNSLHKSNFKAQHGGKDEWEFSNNIPDNADASSLTPSQKEYLEYYG